jgi:hypothetical protein
VTPSGFRFTESLTVRIDVVTTLGWERSRYGDSEVLGPVCAAGGASGDRPVRFGSWDEAAARLSTMAVRYPELGPVVDIVESVIVADAQGQLAVVRSMTDLIVTVTLPDRPSIRCSSGSCRS